MIHWHTGKFPAIAEMLRDGATASDIGAKFGASRNAVIGLVHRHAELKAVGFKRAPSQRKDSQPTRAKAIPSKPRHKTVVVSVVPETQPIPEATFSMPHVVGVPLLMLTDCRCKWPINEGGPFLFCGEVKPQGKAPYCAAHATASVGKGTESERTAVRVALKEAA